MLRLLLKLPIFLVLLFLSNALSLSAQTKLSADAEEAYRLGDYVTALNLYGDVLKSYPTNAIYNHRYGVCLYETNENIDLAEKHLKISSSKGIRLSNYYLGKVYLKKYEFRRAIEYLEAYSRYLRPSDERQSIVQEELNRCNKGLEMIEKTEKIEILDTLIVSKSDFMRYYDISPEAGSFSKLSVDGRSAPDSLFILFMPERKDRCYYSTLDMDKGTRNLAMRNKLLDTWSEETLLSEFINTDKNEILPFVSSDGMTLYFASDAHDGFGGYDIFVTRYNQGTKSFLPPRALPMPFNSPGNDLFYVIDEARNTGWFASDRHNKLDEITIYKFKPGTSKELVSTDDQAKLRAAALINEFAFASRKTVFISSQQAEQKMKDRAPGGVVHFVLNDSTIYHSLADFKSLKARRQYEAYLNLNLKSDSVRTAMDLRRSEYSKLEDDNERKRVADEIVALENQHFALKEEIKYAEKETRKLEWEVIHGELVNTEENDVPWKEAPLQIKLPAVIVPTFYNKDLDYIYKEVFNLIEIKELQAAEEKKLEADNLVLAWQKTLQALNPDKTMSPQTFFSELIHRDSSFTQEPTKEEMARASLEQRNQSTIRYSEAHSMRYHTFLNKVQLDAEQVSDPQKARDVQRLIREAKFNFYDAGPLNNPKNSFNHYNFDQVQEALGKLERANDYLERALLICFKEKVDQGNVSISNEAYDTLKKMDQQKIAFTGTPPNEGLIQKPAKEALPDLFYKVQIGLYRGEPKEELVKKIPPISFEVMEGQNLKRYYSGFYTNKQEAIEMAMELDAIGFPGAFVVPYVKGKRSTWDDVRNYLKTQ